MKLKDGWKWIKTDEQPLTWTLFDSAGGPRGTLQRGVPSGRLIGYLCGYADGTGDREEVLYIDREGAKQFIERQVGARE